MTDEKSKIKGKDIQKIVEEILKFIDPKVKVQIEEGSTIQVNIETTESGSLIGKFGQTLESLQYLIRMMANKLAGEQVSLSVDVSGYKAKKAQELQELALSIADNVKKSGYPQSLRPMNAYERRVIHTALTGFEGVEAVSSGEEPNRYIEIKPTK